jgi:hypothetical protein
MTSPAKNCPGCEAGTPKRGARVCPSCNHEFRGNGWDGIDAHWRSKHESVQSYEEFFSSLCAEHRESRRPLVALTESDLQREAQAVTKFIGGKTVRQVWRHRIGEIGIEFTDGSRIFINRTDAGLEVSGG